MLEGFRDLSHKVACAHPLTPAIFLVTAATEAAGPPHDRTADEGRGPGTFPAPSTKPKRVRSPAAVGPRERGRYLEGRGTSLH